MNAVEFVTRVIDALNRLAIPYMTVGSFSSNLYGRPRSTKDADFVIQLGDRSITQLVAEVGSDFELESQMSFETVTATSRYIIKHRQTAFVVEFFQLSNDPHDQSRFSRRVSGNIGDRQAVVPTAEDVVITKLCWSKHGQRQKDVDDVRQILEIRWRKLDLPYIRSWCDQHNTRDLFEKLLLESQQFEQEHP